MVGLLEIRRKKMQFAMIALVVSLISYLVLMINGLGVGLNQLAGSALLNFDAAAIAYADQAGLSVIRSELGEDAAERAAAAPGVEESALIGYVAVNYRASDGTTESAAVIGFEQGTIAEPRVTDGRPLDPGETGGLLADSSFLKASGMSVGDTVEVSVRLASHEFEIVGEIDEGAFFFQPVVYLLLPAWRDLKYGEQADVPVASVMLLKGEDLLALPVEGLEIVDKPTAFANIEGVAGQQSTVVALRYFGYIVGSLVIGVFFYVLTVQKIPHIGMLKAVGATNTFVFTQILVQVIAVATIGLVLAIPLATITERLLGRLPEAVPIAFTASTFVTTSVALLVTALIGAAFSGR
jgi:putative ABC transport system permease protein